MIDEFNLFANKNPDKIKPHYCFDKKIWIFDHYVYKHYTIKNPYQLEKFKKNFQIFSEINPDFKFLFKNSECYIKTPKLNNTWLDYEDFLTNIEKLILKHKHRLVCFEDIQRNNYFFHNCLHPIDESKIFVCDSTETWTIRTAHSLVEGYKNEVKFNGLSPNSYYDKMIYQITKNLYSSIESSNLTNLGSQ